MKRTTIRSTIYVILIALFALLAITLNKRVQAQGDAVSLIRDQLSQQGVPAKTIGIASQFPFGIVVTVQSASDSNNVAPDDPTYEHIIQRDVALLPTTEGIKVDLINIVIVNTSGQAIYWSDTPVSQLKVLPASQLDDASVALLVRGQMDLHGMTLDSLDIVSDPNSHSRTLDIHLSVSDIAIANQALPTYMPELQALVEQFNTKAGANISELKIELVDSASKPLLKYVADAQMGAQNWYQDDRLTKDWFPHPKPTPTP